MKIEICNSPEQEKIYTFKDLSPGTVFRAKLSCDKKIHYYMKAFRTIDYGDNAICLETGELYAAVDHERVQPYKYALKLEENGFIGKWEE